LLTLIPIGLSMAKGSHLGVLAVILHADVAGSTSLVQKDEHIAHERIQDTFRLLSDTIGKYQGRVLELRGDALLAKFERASDAVTATLAFQAEHAEYTAQLNDNIQPKVRVGIALGEVVIADSTVTGEGVILAQRIEQLAKPGGLCITGAIHEALPQRMPFSQESLGEQSLKGFEESVRVYRVVMAPGESIPPAQEIPQPEAMSKSKKLIAVTAAITLVIAGGAAYWYKPWVTKEEPASVERMLYPLPDKPSIAVLPFDNLSGNPEQEFFADGITNDIITDLSKFGDIVVIAANSTFTYKGKPVKVQQVAEELGVRYVVEGSIQKAGNQVRINVQFIDAITGEHLWAERYVRDLSDVFALQDEITQKIVGILGTWTGRVAQVTREDAMRKGTTDLTAYENFLLGSEHVQRFTKEDNAKAQEFYQRAIEHDPRYARAYAWMAWTHFFDWQRGWSKSEDLSAAQAYEFARKAVELDGDEAEAHSALAVVYYQIRQQPEEAIGEYERALSLNPNHPDILADWGGFSMPFLTGKADEGLKLVKKAMRLNPSHPDWYEQAFGVAAYVARRYDKAISALRKVEYHGVESQAALAASYAQLGRLEEARIEAAKLLEIQPDFSIKLITEKFYFKNPEDLAHHIDGLRKAGIPETPPLSLPDKPSIAVLPFVNMSNDAEQEYFVDGMTEDLITDLSKVSGLFVIARNSVFTYKGKAVKVRQVAEELGVRYVMEGSVRRVGNQVRINAQLIDATTGGHLWAERYDGSLQDIFALQDQVTRKIVSALKISLTVEEEAQQAQHSTGNAEAHDAFLQGWAHYKLGARADLARSIPYLEEAVRLDPGYADAHALLATVYWDALKRDWVFDLGIPSFEVEDRVNHHLDEALKTPNLLAYAQQSRIYLSLGLPGEALREAEMAVALDPNSASAYAALANTLILTNRPQEGLDAIRKAIRLDPHHPPDYLTLLGAAQFGLEQFEAAVTSFERAIKRNPDSETSLIYLASSYGHLGDLRKAEATIETANDLRATNSLGALGLESNIRLNRIPSFEGCSPGEIDFPRFGPKQAQDRLRLGLSKIPVLNWQYLISGPASDASGKTFDSAMGEWSSRDQGPDCVMERSQMTIVDEIKATYTIGNGRIFFYAIDDQRKWEGYWVQDGIVGFDCTDKKDGSTYWGAVTFRFNDTYTQWKGEFDFCGEGRKYPWNGFRQ
jgi:adenylate cyclase